jgi:hypothetical protein
MRKSLLLTLVKPDVPYLPIEKKFIAFLSDFNQNGKGKAGLKGVVDGFVSYRKSVRSGR